jgi:hypothetical protein
MKLLITTLTMIFISFSAIGSIECSKLELKISQLYQDHLELNAMYVKNAKKPLHLWNDEDKRFLNKIKKQSNEKLELSYKYSTIYNVFCK